MYIGTNFPNSAEYSQKIRKHMEQGINPFADFVEAELDYIELAIRHNSVDRLALEADVKKLHQHGLQVNIHPYFNCQGFGNSDDSRLKDNMLAVLEIANTIAQDESRTVLINLHSASGRKSFSGKEDRQPLIACSNAFHTWLMETVDKHHFDVQITTEHQLPPSPSEGKIRIGDSFDELLTLRASNPHDRFHLCWDMGHSAMKNAFYGASLYPPHEFVTLVRHVHIHDVEFNKPVDHRLIGSADSPLQDFVQSLLQVGYTGGFTMEYQVDEFFGADYADFLKKSKSALLALSAEKHIV